MSYSWEIRWKDYYKILQVHPTASQDIIKAAYQRLAKIYHPDAYNDSGATERMAEINEAYEFLGNLEIRRIYHPVWLEKTREKRQYEFEKTDSRQQTHYQDAGTHSTYGDATPEAPYHSPFEERTVGYRGLPQSKLAVILAGVLIVIADVLGIILSVDSSAPAISTSESFLDNAAGNPVAVIIDIILVIFLLMGKGWAKTWILIRLALGMLISGGILSMSGDYPSVLINAGFVVTVFLLLTGRGTKQRIASAIVVLVIAIITGISWSNSIATTPVDIEGYTPVHLENLSLEVPDNWLRSVDFYGPEFFSDIEELDYYVYDAYTDGTGNAELGLTVMYMDVLFENNDYTWTGWDDYEYDAVTSKQSFCEKLTEEMCAGYTKVALNSSDLYSTPDGEQYEFIYTARNEESDLYVTYCFVFSEDDLGMVNMICTAEHWLLFDNCWLEIKNSTKMK